MTTAILVAGGTPLPTLSNGGLTVTDVGVEGAHATTDIAVTTGKHYFEITVPSGQILGVVFGVADYAGAFWGAYLPDGSTSDGIYMYGATTLGTTYDTSLGGTFGIYYDADAGTIGYIVPGGIDAGYAEQPAPINAPSKAYIGAHPYMSQYSPDPGWTVTANFGASAFTHTVPSGYSSGFGSTAAGDNLIAPAPTIAAYGGGDGSAIVAPPTIAAYGGANGSVVAPPPELSAYLEVIGFGGSVISAPTVQARAYGGANSTLTAPTPHVVAYGGAFATLTTPSPTLYALGHDSTGENSFIYTAPSPILSAYAGANAKLTAPSPALTTTATGTNWGSANITAPTPTLSATGTTSGTAQIDLTAPSPNLIGYGGAVCSITLTGSPTVAATGTTGSIGGAQITAPLFALAASGTAQNFGGANLIAPAARLGAQAQAWLIAPGAYLTAIGTATITATHEAYALNLNHTPRKGNEVVNDELTHYTNFPFTHVVRYQNSYFGANSTGLYLLEGTTDNGAPIEWEVKTAYTDFDSAQHKTLEMAYFGGRLGPEATISLHAGEQTTNPYEYTTPRGAAAQNYRQPFGRGQKARYYALGASGDDVVTIDSITLNVATLARKV